MYMTNCLLRLHPTLEELSNDAIHSGIDSGFTKTDWLTPLHSYMVCRPAYAIYGPGVAFIGPFCEMLCVCLGVYW